MTDQDVRDFLERMAAEEPIPFFESEPLARRARRRAARTVAISAVGVAAALAMLFAGVSHLRQASPRIPAITPTPAPAVESGALAYGVDGDIWVANPDGSNAVAITDAVGEDWCPAGPIGYYLPSWSPDGRYLAFRRGACSETELDRDVVITDPQGNVVADFPAQGMEVAWSPDSRRIAVWDESFYNEAGVGRFTIGIYGVDGTREAQIALPPGSDSGGRLVWTPDGASLIVNHLEVPVDGGTPRDIPFAEAFRAAGSGAIWDAALAYSPDGSRVAYGTRHALVVARSDWSERREVFGDPPHTAAWSPTGELIAITSHVRGGPMAPNQLRLVDPVNGSATLLFEDEPGTWLDVIGFSPDGDRVLFGVQRPVLGQPDRTYLFSLWSVGVDGSDAHQIVVGTIDGVSRPT